MPLQNVKRKDREEKIPEDTHVLKLWTPLKFEVKKNYDFVPKSIGFKIASVALYTIALPIVYIYNKVMYQCKIYGKENLEKVKGGKITISNHVHPMDCTMNAMVQAPREVYFPTLEDNFKIPVVNGIIRLLHAIPIPSDVQAKINFYKTIGELLRKGKTIHMYPEAALWPYETKLRHFKNGAFQMAVEEQVPIIPIVFQFVKPQGIRKWKKKPCIAMHILEPVYPNKEESIHKKEAIQIMKKTVYDKMQECLKENPSIKEGK